MAADKTKEGRMDYNKWDKHWERGHIPFHRGSTDP